MSKIKNIIVAIILLFVYLSVMLLFRILINESDRMHFYWDSLTTIAYCLSAVYLTLMTLFSIWRIRHQSFFAKRGKDIFEFIIIPIISLYMIAYTSFAIVNSSIHTYNRIDIFIIHSTVLSLCFLSVILIERISHNRELKMQNIIMQKEQELYRKQISESDRYIREISSIRHDMKNKILCLSEMLSENKIMEAKRLCGQMKSELSNASYVFSTGNIYLNSILNVLYRKAKENHADVKTTIKSELNGIDGEDIITVIGNSGDNAIEAHSKSISITIAEKGGYYVITVKNSITHSVIENNPDLHSTKNNFLYHGHGIYSVKAIAKKYSGEVSIFENDGQFIVSVMLKIPSTTENIPTATKV